VEQEPENFYFIILAILFNKINPTIPESFDILIINIVEMHHE